MFLYFALITRALFNSIACDILLTDKLCSVHLVLIKLDYRGYLKRFLRLMIELFSLNVRSTCLGVGFILNSSARDRFQNIASRVNLLAPQSRLHLN